jgi:hypothetical protein
VTIEEVVVVRPSWVVIHPDDNGSLDPNGVGRIALEIGSHQDIDINIDVERATRILYAELHDDLGLPGHFELLDRPANPLVIVELSH